MATIPQINNPVGGKSYSTGLSGRNTSESGEQFDLIQLTNPLEVQQATDKEAGNRNKAMTGEQKDFLSMSVKIAKDPTMAVESLKQLINEELLGIAKNNGYTELYGELDALMKGMFLKSDSLVADIVAQEKQNTIFSGSEFFDLLRELAAESIANSGAGSVNDEMKNAVGNMLKAVNYMRNKDEILNALSSNMKFLSGYFAPNKGLSEGLAELSRGWAATDAAENFESLKNQTLYIMKSVSESLLNNEQTQVLIPLIVHNLSRYNTNEDILSNYFTQLLAQVPNAETKNRLISAFDNLLNSSFNNTELKQNGELPNNYYNTTNYTTDSEINQPLNPYFSEEKQIPNFLASRLADENYTELLNYSAEDLDTPVKNYLLDKTDGMSAVKDTIGVLIREAGMKDVLANELAGLRTIDSLVEYLNEILQNLPDNEERQIIYENLVEIVNKMAEKEELSATRAPIPSEIKSEMKTETSLKNLIDFVDKNIDHSALKSINNYNASNLLQSLINAPGVFTPLAHYIIPLEVGDSKAFGELWVDKDEENASASVNGGKRKYHLFLTFEIEEEGRFEVDLYALGDEVNISLMHPESFAEKVNPIVRKVNRVIAQSGYVTRNFKTAPLSKPHNLTQIFPHINEKRSGFNVKA